MKTNSIIDLSLPLKESTPGFRLSTARELEKDGWNATNLEIYSHAGTHIDAPLHFGVSEESIDQIPVNRFICDCHIVTIQNPEPSSLIGMEAIKDIENDVHHGHGIILKTGWSRYADDTSMYRDRLPRVSEELALWMVSKEICMLGVEPPSVADVNNIDEIQNIHRLLLGAGIIIIEGLANLEQLTARVARIIALPLKIAGGDGAPARVVAIEY